MKKNKLYLLFLFPFLSCVQFNNDGSKITDNQSVTQQNKKSDQLFSEDEFYSIYYLGNSKIKITNVRPNQSDTAIQLCIPAAFTQLDDGSIDGLFMMDGKIVDAEKVNHHLGGGFLINNNHVSIIKTDDGKLLTTNFLDSISQLKISFFQQIQLVRDGASLEFNRDQKLFQRRAVILLSDGKIAVIESKSPMTLQEFADDLVKMKIQNAIYTDMGSYDEGWVRSPENGAVIVLGHNLSETKSQSNWLLFTN